MKILLKMIAVPVMLALGLLKALLSFVCSVADWISWVLCIAFLLGGAYSCFIAGDTSAGIRDWIMAFIFSPFALPALAWWAVELLGDLNYSIHSFVVS